MKGAFIHPLLICKIDELEDGKILVKFRYSISEAGYLLIALILLSVLFNYKNIVGLPIAIVVLAGFYFSQYKKINKDFIEFCNHFT